MAFKILRMYAVSIGININRKNKQTNKHEFQRLNLRYFGIEGIETRERPSKDYKNY